MGLFPSAVTMNVLIRISNQNAILLTFEQMFYLL